MRTIKNGALGALCLVMLAFGFAPRAQAAYTDDCITFSSAASFTLKTNNDAKNWDGTLWASTDKTDWIEWNGEIVMAAWTGGTYNLYVRGNTSNTKITGFGFSDTGCWILDGVAGIACSGNIETLRGATGNNPSPTKMADYCYSQMFRDCTALTSAPALPAKTLAEGCYDCMFYRCTSLTNAPALPATTLAKSCYDFMFGYCTSLTTIPVLRATTLVYGCYRYMFYGCSALVVNAAAPGKGWKIPVTATAANDWGSDMFRGTGGTLRGQPALNTTYYVMSAREPNADCITFSSAASFTLKAVHGKNWDGTLWTSPDKVYWTEWYGEEVAAAQAGGTYNLYVRGDASNTKIAGWGWGYGGDCRYCSWALAGSNIACTGNIETLRGATGNNPSPTPMAATCYLGIFADCTLLTSAPALPATTLAGSCYAYMFQGCTSLTAAPVLPATTLAYGCYKVMFAGCTSLTAAPVLPATTLTDECYQGMFSGCTLLTSAPALPATTLTESCYDYMFSRCTSLTHAPALPATTLASCCYDSMFFGCTALTEAPALPATTLTYCCYLRMFFGCKALKEAPSLPATTMAESCCQEMFYGCTSLTNAPALPATTLAMRCYDSMFSGCSSLISAPALPATTLANGCYSEMFARCTSLEVNAAAPGKEWKIPVASTTASSWGYNMFTGTGGTLQGQPALNTTYYIASALPKPIEPGGEIVVPEGKAEAKATEINNDPAIKAQYLKAPEGVETTADYLGCFDAVATSGSTVAFVLNEKGTNEVAEATTVVNAATLDVVFSEESTMTIDKPLVGFYYSFKQGGDVSVGDQADLNKLGGRDTISFELTKGPLQYFYQTLVTPTALPAK